jgi:hypothetical protein
MWAAPALIASLPVHTFFYVPLEGWLTIAAIIVGPLAALLIQNSLDRWQAREERKTTIFRNLMANRASRLSQVYVQSLNGIETEFYGQTRVIEAWRALIDHLYTPQPTDYAENQRWSDRNTDNLSDLLYEMGESLGYHFDKVTLKRNVYSPLGWNWIETENTKLRKAAIKIFEGEIPLNVKITNEVAASPLPPPERKT